MIRGRFLSLSGVGACGPRTLGIISFHQSEHTAKRNSPLQTTGQAEHSGAKGTSGDARMPRLKPLGSSRYAAESFSDGLIGNPPRSCA
jgi:hypothetical protein